MVEEWMYGSFDFRGFKCSYVHFGLLVEGGDPGVLISKNFSPESLEHIQNESLPCLTLKPFTSPFAFDIGKMKAPSGLLVSRNTSALHDPLVIDSCFLEGKKE